MTKSSDAYSAYFSTTFHPHRQKEARIFEAFVEKNINKWERTSFRFQALYNIHNLWDHGSCQNLGGHHQKHSKTHYSGRTYNYVKRLPFLHTEVSSPRNWEGSNKFRRDKYEGLPKGADPKSRVSKAARPGVVKQSPSAVRVIKSIQGHLNVQGSGVAGIVVLWSQTLGSICLRVWVSEQVREKERSEGETRGYIQTSDSHYLISVLRDRLQALHFQQEARSEWGGTISLLHTTTCLVAENNRMTWSQQYWLKFLHP